MHPSLSEVEQLIKSSKSACKEDPLPIDLMHKLSSFLAPHIHYVICESIDSGYIPTSLKRASIIPLIKNSSESKIIKLQAHFTANSIL